MDHHELNSVGGGRVHEFFEKIDEKAQQTQTIYGTGVNNTVTQ
jgi:hypothetical protein